MTLTLAKNIKNTLLEILDSPQGTVFDFRHGEIIENGGAFNEYLDANVGPGRELSVTKEQIMMMSVDLEDKIEGGQVYEAMMICRGEGNTNAKPVVKPCFMLHSCSLHKAGIPLPVNEQCPLEKMAAKVMLRDLVKAFQQEFTDDISWNDKNMLRNVVAYELQKIRIQANMARFPDPIIKQQIGVDHFGKAINNVSENPNNPLYQRAVKSQMDILKQLLMTPEQRFRYKGGKKIISPSDQAASYRDRLREIESKHGAKYGDAPIMEAKLTGDKNVEMDSGSDGDAGFELDGEPEVTSGANEQDKQGGDEPLAAAKKLLAGLERQGSRSKHGAGSIIAEQKVPDESAALGGNNPPMDEMF